MALQSNDSRSHAGGIYVTSTELDHGHSKATSPGCVPVQHRSSQSCRKSHPNPPGHSPIPSHHCKHPLNTTHLQPGQGKALPPSPCDHSPCYEVFQAIPPSLNYGHSQKSVFPSLRSRHVFAGRSDGARMAPRSLSSVFGFLGVELQEEEELCWPGRREGSTHSEGLRNSRPSGSEQNSHQVLRADSTPPPVPQQTPNPRGLALFHSIFCWCQAR